MAAAGQAAGRVFVTGRGAVTAFGLHAEQLFEGVRMGRVAIGPVRRLPMDGYQTAIGGEVPDAAAPEHDYHRPPGFREPVMDLLLHAVEEAMKGTGPIAGKLARDRCGVVSATCNGGIISGERWFSALLAWDQADARTLQLFPGQSMADAIAGALGFRGPAVSLNTACASGANAIGYAHELIRQGHADVMVAAAADALSAVLFAGFSAMEALSPFPARPYSAGRSGLSIGEGAGAVVLMSEQAAELVGAPIHAELRGYGLSADGYHPTAPNPEGEGAARAIVAALAAADVRPEQVGYVNGHGTGTPINDPAETNGIKLALGQHAAAVALSSTKSMIGHLMGAAGLVEAIVTIEALATQIAPPTAGYLGPDPECDLDCVPNQARPISTDVAISNNLAFGGANACLVFARPGALEPPPPLRLDRIAITGIGAVTHLGVDADAAWKDYQAGGDADGPGRITIDTSPWLSSRETRRMDRTGTFAVIASRLALESGKLTIDPSNRHRVGTIAGTYLGPAQALEAFMRPMLLEGPHAVSPAVFPNSVFNAAAGHVAVNTGAVGPTSTLTTGHAAGAAALAYAADLLARDAASALIAIGVDTLTETLIRAYTDLGLVDGPHGRLRLSEAAVGVLLERWTEAKGRGADILAEVLGYGVASDGRGIGRLDPAGRGVERAQRLALERARLRSQAIEAVWTSAAGCAVADRAEHRAIDRVFGPATIRHSPKMRLGEAMGASGLVTLAVALASLREGPRGPILVNSSSLSGTHFAIVLAPAA